MSHRDAKKADFSGKTIKRVDSRAFNIWKFYFTDGTSVAIEVEHAGHGLWGLQVCDECAAL